jgi:hypothetical protein
MSVLRMRMPLIFDGSVTQRARDGRWLPVVNVSRHSVQTVRNSGYFGSCDRCGDAIEGSPVTYKVEKLPGGGHRHFHEDCI